MAKRKEAICQIIESQIPPIIGYVRVIVNFQGYFIHLLFTQLLFTMKTRLVIFADGTWNSPSSTDNGKPVPTNVLSGFVDTVREHCENGDEQIVYYEEGVGTGDSRDQFLGGLFGKGIDDRILDLYRFIVERYTPGTEIFLLGFSRGAYTVRSLVGLINNCGILRKEYLSKAKRAYFIYRSHSQKNHPQSDECEFFRDHFSHPLTHSTIKFVGVWDTVGSLGIPFKLGRISQKKYRFHDVKLSWIVENAYHALALDETRVFFAPTLWQKKNGTDRPNQKLEQVWFSGVHSDVGGGYASGDLFKLPMHYLLTRAKEHGLVASLNLTKADLERSTGSKRNESRVGFYRAFPKYVREVGLQKSPQPAWKRLVFRMFNNIPEVPAGYHTHEFLHVSALDRYKTMHSPEVRDLGPYVHTLGVIDYEGGIAGAGN